VHSLFTPSGCLGDNKRRSIPKQKRNIIVGKAVNEAVKPIEKKTVEAAGIYAPVSERQTQKRQGDQSRQAYSSYDAVKWMIDESKKANFPWEKDFYFDKFQNDLLKTFQKGYESLKDQREKFDSKYRQLLLDTKKNHDGFSTDFNDQFNQFINENKLRIYGEEQMN
jgi:hypothetical protein